MVIIFWVYVLTAWYVAACECWRRDANSCYCWCRQEGHGLDHTVAALSKHTLRNLTACYCTPTHHSLQWPGLYSAPNQDICWLGCLPAPGSQRFSLYLVLRIKGKRIIYYYYNICDLFKLQHFKKFNLHSAEQIHLQISLLFRFQICKWG